MSTSELGQILANFAFIRLPRPLDVHALTKLIVAAKDAVLGPLWRVMLPPCDGNEVMWIVHLPGTAVFDPKEAIRRALAPGDDVGFAIYLEECDGDLELCFRHSFNPFERWAQGCIEEQLADVLEAGVFYDATEETWPPGTRLYRVGSFFEFVTQNFDKPLSETDRAFLDRRFRSIVPAGFWP